MAQDVPLQEWILTTDGPVATIKFGTVHKPLSDYMDHHLGVGLALEKVRFDDNIRVVVITGDPGGLWELGPVRGVGEAPREIIDPATRPGGPGAVVGPWSWAQGIERTFQALAAIEKPVIGCLNGDAYGFAMHILWGCDVVVADQDAILCDVHLSLDPYLPYGMTAGDGAFAFMPLFLPPTKMKEFLLLGPEWTARDFADLHMINYALPADQVNAKVDELVQKFLERPARALARTKRAANKALINQMNLTLDYAWLAELVDTWELPYRDWKPDTTLRPDDPLWKVDDPDAPLTSIHTGDTGGE